MADSLLAAAASVTSHPGFEPIDQNIVCTDRHNIPDCDNPVSQKYDSDVTPDADIDAPEREPPPPYSPLPPLPQYRLRDDPATLNQPAAEILQTPAHVLPLPEPHPLRILQPELQHSPPELHNPESDPRYKCLQAQDRNAGDCCGISFPKVYLRLNKLYTFEQQCGCTPSGVVNRLGNLADSPMLQRAFIAGWAMLATITFGRLPSWTYVLWLITQFVIALFSLVYTCLTIIEDCTNFWAHVVISATGLLFALVDMLYMYSRTRPEEGERQPLIRNEQNQRMCSRLTMWLSKYSDLLRLIITEAMGYAFVVTTLTNECPFLGSSSVLSAVFPSSGAFFILVYVVQFLLICRILYVCWRMRPKFSTNCQGAFLMVMFLLLFIGERIIQGFGLFIIGVAPQVDTSSLIILIIGTCFVPVLGFVTYFIRSHGEIVDFCIVYCTSYLRELEQISERPSTSLGTKNAIQAILRRYDFEALQVRSEPYFNWRNLYGNCYQRLFSPVVNILSLLCSVAGALYFSGILIFGTCVGQATSDCTSNIFLLIALIIFFLVVNAHILCIAISPIATLLYLAYR